MISLMIMTWLWSCTAKSVNKGAVGGVDIWWDCDTNFIQAIRAIERDSFQLTGEHIYRSWLIPNKRDTVSGALPKYLFVSEYHESLNFLSCSDSNALDTIFSNEELKAYEGQNFKIQTLWYPQFDFVDRDTVDTWFNFDWGSGESSWPEDVTWFYSFSKPLLSEDSRYMLIEMWGCCGRLCGGGFTYLFERQNREWVNIRTMCGLVS